MLSHRLSRHSARGLLTALAALALAGCATATTGVATATPAEDRGLVSAADPRAAEAGAEILREGGSATDAAIATMLALNVVEPQSSGIGGGGFYVRGAADGTVETIDGRETAPAAAGPDWFLDGAGKPLPFMTAVLSGRSVGVPGNLALAAEAHERHGKLPWAKLFEPAIRLARNGWALSERGRRSLADARDRGASHPAGKALFYDAGGEPVPVGTVVHNEALAQTFERIAREGPDAFYQGDNAEAIAGAAWAETPGARGMVTGDLAAYSARERPAVCGAYRE
jgi:gamma-glutamyltranspeptidase/glutathione hydrolase